MSIAFANGDEAAASAAGSIATRHDDPARGFGAALAGRRVVGITNRHGLRAALEQLGVQAGLRVPMVLNVACARADLIPALHSGWIVLCARDAQSVYDLNLAAVKIGEHADVRLPVLVAYDEVTSREKRRLELMDDEAIRGFVGARPAWPSPLDTAHPATLRPANQDIELSRAMQAVQGVTAGVLAELAQITGRKVEPAPLDALQPVATPERAPAERTAAARPGLGPIPPAALARGMAKVRRNETSGRLEVELEPLWKMTGVPNRLAPGHGACPGCGALTTLHQVYKVLEGDVVMLLQGGCASAVTGAAGSSAHRINVVHDIGTNGAAVLCGLVEAAPERKDVTFVLLTGDGGMDAGMASALGAASRNARMMILEYDNQGRMSTGGQASHSTALGRRIANDEIFAACRLPYVFTASEGYPEDLMRKVAKAQWYAKNEGMVYGSILSFCPLHWRTADDAAQPVLQAAIDSCFFPLYEVERGSTAITYDPDATGRRRPVADWLKLMGKTRDLPSSDVEGIQRETERRWSRLKALHEHPLL